MMEQKKRRTALYSGERQYMRLRFHRQVLNWNHTEVACSVAKWRSEEPSGGVVRASTSASLRLGGEGEGGGEEGRRGGEPDNAWRETGRGQCLRLLYSLPGVGE